MYYNEPEMSDVSTDLKETLRALASSSAGVVVAHGPNHGAYYAETGCDKVPATALRTISRNGFTVTQAGVSDTPSPEGRRVTFARSDAREGEDVGWVEFR